VVYAQMDATTPGVLRPPERIGRLAHACGTPQRQERREAGRTRTHRLPRSRSVPCRYTPYAKVLLCSWP